MSRLTALVLGGGGFIGSHMVRQLKTLGYWVRAVDLVHPEFSETAADEFIIGDLRNTSLVKDIMCMRGGFDIVFQKAADMGGAIYIFTGENDADIMHNSGQINMNVADAAVTCNVKKLFYSSSACIYPSHIQEDPANPGLKESDAYPANPDSNYGWEKLMSENMFMAYHKNFGLNVRIARFHNIFGEETKYDGDRAKAPAAICRKVAMARDGEEIEIFGDGKQTRSFLYIDECIEGILRLCASEYRYPINIGSDEMISINDLAKMVIEISGKKLTIKNIEGPTGVRGRNSQNDLIKKELGWAPSQPLHVGMKKLYAWVNSRINA